MFNLSSVLLRLFSWTCASRSLLHGGPPKASCWGLPPEWLHRAYSPVYDHSGAFLPLRYRGSTAVALYRTPRYVPPRRISSSTYFGPVHDRPLLCGQRQGSDSTGYSPSSCEPCTIKEVLCSPGVWDSSAHAALPSVRHYFRVWAILRHRLPLLLASCPLLLALPRPAQLFSCLL